MARKKKTAVPSEAPAPIPPEPEETPVVVVAGSP